MTEMLPYIQAILGILLTAGVLLQRSEAGLGSGFGGEGSMGTKFVRRGFEKTIFNGTLILAVLFVVSVVAPLFLR